MTVTIIIKNYYCHYHSLALQFNLNLPPPPPRPMEELFLSAPFAYLIAADNHHQARRRHPERIVVGTTTQRFNFHIYTFLSRSVSSQPASHSPWLFTCALLAK